jgi:cytochrome c peroxidase
VFRESSTARIGARNAEIEAVFRADRIAGRSPCHLRLVAADRAIARHGTRSFTCGCGVGVGVDSFQADRSPTHMYRTAPLAGLWSHQKVGFYHDGRFGTLKDVVAHYATVLHLTLSDREQDDLTEYLKSL